MDGWCFTSFPWSSAEERGGGICLTRQFYIHKGSMDDIKWSQCKFFSKISSNGVTFPRKKLQTALCCLACTLKNVGGQFGSLQGVSERQNQLAFEKDPVGIGASIGSLEDLFNSACWQLVSVKISFFQSIDSNHWMEIKHHLVQTEETSLQSHSASCSRLTELKSTRFYSGKKKWKWSLQQLPNTPDPAACKLPSKTVPF